MIRPKIIEIKKRNEARFTKSSLFFEHFFIRILSPVCYCSCMPGENYKKLISEIKSVYSSLMTTWCPALNETVYFNHDGLRHLLGNTSGRRSMHDLAYRFALLKHAKYVITNSHAISKYRLHKNGKIPVHFWSIEFSLDNMALRCVVRAVGSGRKHFYSIMKVS
jgi:hypothetical protein